MAASYKNLLSALAVALLAIGESRADSIVLAYNGNNSLDGGDFSSGTGSISFTPIAGPIGLAQVTAFSFVLNTDLGFIFNLGLPNLTSFSLSSASPGATISLTTGFVPVVAGNTSPESFSWAGVLPVSTGQVTAFQAAPGSSFSVDSGSVTPTYVVVTSSVPEPASVTLMFTAGVFALAALRRRTLLGAPVQSRI
jgi:hypothetical protein